MPPQLFDKDSSGTIDKAELYDILTFKGSGRDLGLGDELAKDILAQFDGTPSTAATATARPSARPTLADQY